MKWQKLFEVEALPSFKNSPAMLVLSQLHSLLSEIKMTTKPCEQLLNPVNYFAVD